jgi:hypothetical protein
MRSPRRSARAVIWRLDVVVVVDAVLDSAMNPQSPSRRHKVAERQRYFEGIAAAVVRYQPCEPEQPLHQRGQVFQEQTGYCATNMAETIYCMVKGEALSGAPHGRCRQRALTYDWRTARGLASAAVLPSIG